MQEQRILQTMVVWSMLSQKDKNHSQLNHARQWLPTRDNGLSATGNTPAGKLETHAGLRCTSRTLDDGEYVSGELGDVSIAATCPGLP